MTNGIQGGCWRQRWTRMWKGGHRQTCNIVTRMWQMLDKDMARRRWTRMWQERGGLKCDKEEVDKEMTRRRWTRMWQIRGGQRNDKEKVDMDVTKKMWTKRWQGGGGQGCDKEEKVKRQNGSCVGAHLGLSSLCGGKRASWSVGTKQRNRTSKLTSISSLMRRTANTSVFILCTHSPSPEAKEKSLTI